MKRDWAIPILYTTIDPVSDSSESESENESETVERIAKLTCIDSFDFFNFLDFFRSSATKDCKFWTCLYIYKLQLKWSVDFVAEYVLKSLVERYY